MGCLRLDADFGLCGSGGMTRFSGDVRSETAVPSRYRLAAAGLGTRTEPVGDGE